MRNATLIALFEESVRRFGKNVLLWEKRGDTYCGMTYAEAHARVRAFAAGLMSLGINRGDRIALIAEGRSDWVIAELGMLFAGAVNVPLSIKLQEGHDLQFRLSHAECCCVITSGGQARKIRQLRGELPLVRHVVVLDHLERYEPGETTFDALLKIGQSYRATHETECNARAEAVREQDPATICYTSGTTADPKGVILTHRNYTANVEQASAIINVPPWFVSLLILPWDHCFAHTAGIYTLMKNGASMAAVQSGKTALETLKNIPQNIREIRPTFLLSVPALAKSFRKNIENGVRQKGAVASFLFEAGLNVGYAYNGIGWDRGRGWRRMLKPLVKLFDGILFRKIRENFGGRLLFFVGGGALLDIELQRFYYALGIPMFQGYGLSESSPIISANTPQRHKLGSSGIIVPHLDVKICNDDGKSLPIGSQGEIVIRGENVMAGYWKNDKATTETIRDGWLFTGDLGYVDADGFLYVLGRTKSLLIASDGEKYSPEGIEETLCSQSTYIDQMLLYNNQSPYTVALVVPNKDGLLKAVSAHHAPSERPATLLRKLAGEVDAYRPGGKYAGMFPERWLPSAMAILGEGFTEQNGMLNSTLKMVRGRILEAHQVRIDQLYTSAGKDICSRTNLDVVASWE
jgi:long-chain acyl-CoA synthetase